MKNATLAVLFCCFLGFGQAVNISGKIVNSTFQPVQGAVVKLFVQAMACTSKADGTYLLSGQTPGGVALPRQGYEWDIAYKNRSFLFYAAAPVSAHVSLFDSRGRVVGLLLDGMLRSGVTMVHFPLAPLGHGLYFLRARIGGSDATYPLSSIAVGGFRASGSQTSRSGLAKTESVDWLQASKAGYAASFKTIDSYTGVVNCTLSTISGAPNFGPNVKIFDPTMAMSTIQSTMSGFSTGEFSTNRVAWFFKPGSYTLNISVNFYIQAYGLGMSPEDVQITGSVQDVSGEGTGSFWRGAEGFSFTPSGGTDVWGVSQADPFRRNHVKGQLNLCTNGASGGFIADCKIDGAISTNCEQQFYLRNSAINGCNAGGVGGIWNMLFQGCDNPQKPTPMAA